MESVNSENLNSYGKAVSLERFKNKFKELTAKIRNLGIVSFGTFVP